MLLLDSLEHQPKKLHAMTRKKASISMTLAAKTDQIRHPLKIGFHKESSHLLSGYDRPFLHTDINTYLQMTEYSR